MRILHIHSGNLYGGVETVLRAMARVSVPGVDPQFALSFEGRIAAELRTAGRRVHILGAARASRPFSVMQARARLAALCGGGRFDAVVAHSAWSMALLAPAASPPLIYYQHDVLTGRPWTERWARRTPPGLVIANSDFTARSTARVYPQCRVIRVYPPVELLAPQPRQKVTDRMVIVQAGRFDQLKGQALLLDALGRLAGDPRWVLWVAGAAQRPAEVLLLRKLENQAAALGIGNRVSFLGHVSAMPALLASADIYCQPNIAPESFGLTFIEALNARLPVLATNLGGAREILAPDWGTLVAPRADSVAEGLAQLLNFPHLSEGGPQRARAMCDAPTQIQAFVDAIGSLRERRNTA
jgi:glycosyltransferase involved in cell wall biosynthesis